MPHPLRIQPDAVAEAFNAWAVRLLVTAQDRYWLDAAIVSATGYATSLIGCDAEAGLDEYVSPDATPDGRPGASLLFFHFKPEPLAKAVANRAGQCVMTCPTTAVFDHPPESVAGDWPHSFVTEEAGKSPGPSSSKLGGWLRWFGDGYQKKAKAFGRQGWSIPTMEGDFFAQDQMTLFRSVAGGNFLLGAARQPDALTAAKFAAQAAASVPGAVTCFPGGVVRSGSKVGSENAPKLKASTNHRYCPTLAGQAALDIPEDVSSVYEIVVNGIDEPTVRQAMALGLKAAISHGATWIGAGQYGGRLGKRLIPLSDLLALP